MGRNLNKELYDTAELACDYAFANATEEFKTLKGGRACFYPVVKSDEDTIGIGVNPDYHYLIYQENGFASFPMTWAFGRVIPLHVDGRIIYRKCTGINRFQPGHKNYWARDANGELYPEFKQKRSWVHPGLPPKNFMERAIDQAIEEKEADIEAARIKDEEGLAGKAWRLLNTLQTWLSRKIGR